MVDKTYEAAADRAANEGIEFWQIIEQNRGKVLVGITVLMGVFLMVNETA